MSVVGFDVGNESGVVAVARQKGINVVLNDEPKLETPAVVCFGKKQRFLGTAGAASSTMNPKYTISQIKRFIGRKFSDAGLLKDLKSLPFPVTEGPDGYPLIHAQYLGENRTFTPTQILGMVLSDLKIIAEKTLNSAVVDCCIGIPVYFTELQRRAVIDAATLAGLNPLHLIHETTATALAYGIYKTDLPENKPMNVAFVDVGHASTQVCIAAFKKGQLRILAHSYDQCLGGRDFDKVLFQHFAAKFKDEYNIDVYRNARACLRLRAACEKLKKVLSENAEASLNIECLMDEKDVLGFIMRDEFEQISIPILERVKKPLEKALTGAGLTTQNIHSIEVVGSGSRVPAIIKILTEFFGKEPRQTMNASQCVAEGSALQCAILSPTFQVQDFQVIESFPFPIYLSWNMPAPDDTQTGAADLQQNVLVFHPGNCMPSVKALTFYRSGTFTLDVHYIDDSEPLNISTYMIGPFQSTNGKRVKLKLKVRLNIHGIASIESAMIKDGGNVNVPFVKVPAKEGTKMKTDDVHPSSSETDVNMQDAKTDGPGAENGVLESGDEKSQMEMDKNTEARLEGLERAMEDQAARTSAIEAKFDLINKQIAALGSRIGLKESTAAEESTTLPYQQTVGLPKFDGSDALAWLASADHYFLVHKTPMEKRVELALTSLSGPAMSWIQILLRRSPDLTWDQFTDELLIRFGSEPTLDGYESLRTTSQEGALDDYIAAFEGRLAQLPELTEKQYLGFFLGGLNPQIRMQIRDPTTITTYTAALKMAKHIDSLFKCMRDEECKRRKVADRAEIIHGGLAASDVQKAVKKEFEMALQDCVMEETKDKKNAVQGYIYGMRNKLHDKYYEFVAESDRNQLISKLQEVEDWLYEDGKDETKGVYVAKLDELKKQGDPIEERFKEHSERGTVINQLIYCINSYREAAMSIDSKFDKLKVLNECVEAEAWLREMQQRQDTLPKYTPPVLLSADVRKKAESLDRFCRPIMTKPAAKPSAPEPSSAFWR